MRRARFSTGSVWLQLLLLGALASLVLLFLQAFRLGRHSRDVADRALQDYGAFAAWSYREHLIVHLREIADETLGPVNHGDGLHFNPRVPSAGDMGHLLPWSAECACHETRKGPLPTRFYAFRLGTDTLGIALNYAQADPGWLGDPPAGRAIPIPMTSVGSSTRQALNERLSVAARDTASTWGYRVMLTDTQSQSQLLISRNMPTEWGDTIVYAAAYSEAAADSLFRSTFTRSDILPPSLVGGKSNASIIDLEVRHADGTQLFVSRENTPWRNAQVNFLPHVFGGLRIQAQIRPELAESLLIGGVPESRVPVLLLLLVLTLGLTVVAAIQLRRDITFAAERSNFVANVSHELRTPLAQVRLVLDTIRLGRGGSASQTQSALALADREVLRLQHRVDGLLQFTTAAHRQAMPFTTLDAAEEVRQTVAEFLPLASSRGTVVEVSGVERLVVSMQQGALRQVVLNLLDNAVKYGGDGQHIVVHVSSVADAALRLSVTDAGSGVPVADRDRIWEPFVRGAAARNRASGGSGIGLTIVRDIARAHGARVWVEDAQTGGARFVFDLPTEQT